MARNRVRVYYPADVIAAVDEITGIGQRTSFLIDLAKRAIKLDRRLKAIRAAKGAWKQADHRELAQGAAVWIRQIREGG